MQLLFDMSQKMANTTDMHVQISSYTYIYIYTYIERGRNI